MIIADTGFWLALANRRDRHHTAAVAWFTGADEGLMTTWPAVTECCHRLLTQRGRLG